MSRVSWRKGGAAGHALGHPPAAECGRPGGGLGLAQWAGSGLGADEPEAEPCGGAQSWVVALCPQ